MKLPVRALANSAFWICTSETNYRYIKNPQRPTESGGEIDILEYFATWGGTKYAATSHWFGWSGYHQSSGSEPDTGLQLAGEWHTYSLVWTKTGHYWYVDGMLTRAYTGEGAQAKNSDPFDVRLQMNVNEKGVDSDWGGAYVEDAFPDETLTDWVEVYGLSEG